MSAAPPELDGVGIDPNPGSELPRDARLTGSDGRSFILGEYADGEHPLVLVLAYYRCPMLCSLVLSGLNKAIKGIDKTAGKDFRVLVVSFDPNDTTEVAQAKRESYLADYGRDVDVHGFEYATGTEREVRRIADSVGFHYRWDDAQQQYAHAAGLFVVTPQGKLSQTFLGVSFDPADVNAALDDSARGTWHSPLKGALLYCFRYDPKTGKYVPVVIQMMKVVGALTLGVVGLFLLLLFRGERRKSQARARQARDAEHARESTS